MAPTMLMGLFLLTLIGPRKCENVTEVAEPVGNFTEAPAKEIHDDDVSPSVVDHPDHVTDQEEETTGHSPTEGKAHQVDLNPTTEPSQEISKSTMPPHTTTRVPAVVTESEGQQHGEIDTPDEDLCATDKWSSQCPEVKEPGQDIPVTPESCATARESMGCYDKLRGYCAKDSKHLALVNNQVQKFDILIVKCNETKTNTKEGLGGKQNTAVTISWSVSAMLMAMLLLYTVADMPIAVSKLVSEN